MTVVIAEFRRWEGCCLQSCLLPSTLCRLDRYRQVDRLLSKWSLPQSRVFVCFLFGLSFSRRITYMYKSEQNSKASVNCPEVEIHLTTTQTGEGIPENLFVAWAPSSLSSWKVSTLVPLQSVVVFWGFELSKVDLDSVLSVLFGFFVQSYDDQIQHCHRFTVGPSLSMPWSTPNMNRAWRPLLFCWWAFGSFPTVCLSWVCMEGPSTE